MKMVLRPSSLPQSPIISRGHSPLRNGTYRKTPSPNTNTGPAITTMGKQPTRSSSMSNGFRGISPSRSLNGINRGRSPQKNAPILIRSRGNEKGSIDNIASKSNGNGSNPTTPEDNINVVIRVRPLNNKEVRSGDEMVTQFPGHGQILCDISATPGSSSGAGQKAKLFSYNVVFEPGANQEDVLQYSGIKRLIEMAIEGFCCTAFCYGQTGSGKTHTLTGPPELFKGRKPNLTDERHGLVFRSFIYLFKLLQARKDVNFVLKASFLEIYNEKVIDLLNPGSARKPLAVRWSKKSRSFFVENLFTVDCEELDDLLAVLEEGMRNRSVGSHAMNDYSSRSHTILTVHITSEQQAEGGVFISKQGKINFVDLAGSEMTKKTHSEGKTLEEANNINKSLMVLGYCIASLSDSRKRNGHIPYRDSKLTKLLADSLAGNGVTLMIACISPARSNETETVNTLRYAARAKKIRTKPIIVMDPREALILSLKREIGILHQENDHLRAVLQLNASQAPTPLSQTPNTEITTAHPFGEEPAIKRIIPEAPKIDLEKIAELDGTELSELVKLYMVENRALRTENSELSTTRDMVLRDHEIVCRENERLLKKLEDVNSVCCRSPLIPARPTFSAEMLNMPPGSEMDSNVWTNPMAVSMDSSFSKDKSDNDALGERISSIDIPDSIQKELDKRKIGESLTSNNFRRHNSWENSRSSSGGSQSNRSRKDSAGEDKNHLTPSQQFVEVSNFNKSSSHSSLTSGGNGRHASTSPSTRPSSTLSQSGRQRTLPQINQNRRMQKTDLFGSIVSLNEF